MRHFEINSEMTDGQGGYIARTIGKAILSSIPVSAWTHFYHKPYSLDDWAEAKRKAIDRCVGDPISYNGVVRKA